MRNNDVHSLMRAVGSCALALCASGCGFVPKTQFNAAETQARILSEQSKAQLAEIANLKTHSRKLEDQLLAAEKELAAIERRSESDQKRIGNFQVEREKVQEQVQGLVRGATLTGIVPVRDDEIEQLAKRYPLLRFDSATGAYKLDAELAFEGRDARMTPQSEKVLGEFASLFAEPSARELRVLVVGRAPPDGANAKAATGEELRIGAERALAVAQFLKKVGLRGEQIGVSGLGGAKASSTPPAATAKGVEIFVMGRKTPIVGWDESSAGRY